MKPKDDSTLSEDVGLFAFEGNNSDLICDDDKVKKQESINHMESRKDF